MSKELLQSRKKCLKKCRLSDDKLTCVGCGRTMVEIEEAGVGRKVD